MVKITKEDFKNNSYNCKCIISYTIILAIIYGAWIFLEDKEIPHRLLLTILTICFILIAGGVCLFLSLRKTAIKRIESNKSNEEKIEE